MRRRLGAAVLCGLALTALATAGPARALSGIPNGMPYAIAAQPTASYTLVCKFRAVRVWGRALINQYYVSDKGPTHGHLPSDNARCTLTKTAGPGAVVLALIKNGKARTVAAAQTGAPVKVTVL